ncbi:alpha-ketoglutarate-dependent dioxygenase AlkB family protein [Rhodovulum sulfidophilum]|uniref:alpha-ketoglutarate-dependent dioxygenase AlkB family protein n=1 Tax=Rhodovulum sulfidophilum TaxID=35806 RepID=UPI000951A2E6|nr:alpha-ketoglutarate-dependent dioxygenase AlkB [Rhodovulum sulfidophilum]MBL3550940.1 alpha-ketoglutarate-dependent dioxygenase AlkB [Rhodovulum sulfidophilum]MBL3564917.1 alpha-ketoglutarate-dependent dioxygenase AlkB [Rhodovulum sulfidophilum]NDK35803.1 alpha-ketoglutarate-dependent dioxygenase AlkB [Rhodovulum sulfidophilum]OLS47084.1 alkylated DNA repair dioxygenase [Rhodovulum sulfidophilum]
MSETERPGRPVPGLVVRGVEIFPGLLDSAAQAGIMAEIAAVMSAAPPVQPETRFGRKMSVRMTSAGKYGWVSDRRGYRYETRHPSGVAWPPIPAPVLALWHRVTGLARAPDCCLVNLYRDGAKMGLHQDRDEADFSWPILSVSLGDEARFRIGDVTRGGPTESLWLKSGDVLAMRGAARLIHHGIDRVRGGSSTLIEGGGRINLTLRVVD